MNALPLTDLGGDVPLKVSDRDRGLTTPGREELMTQQSPTIAQAIASLSGRVREQLSHLSITTAHMTCHTRGPQPAASGPIATEPEIAEQLQQLEQMDIVGSLHTETREGITTVTLWADQRQAWTERMELLKAHPHAGGDLLERTARVKLERARWQAAAQSAADRAATARISGLAESTITALLQESIHRLQPTEVSPSRANDGGTAQARDDQPPTREGFVRMPLGHNAPCVVCATPATHTFQGQPLHQGECANSLAGTSEPVAADPPDGAGTEQPSWTRLAQETVELFVQETAQVATESPVAAPAPAAASTTPPIRPGFERMPVGRSAPCVVCGTPATHTRDGQPLHQGECANRHDPPAPATAPPAAPVSLLRGQPVRAPVQKKRRAKSGSKTPDRSRFHAAVAAWDGQTLHLPGGRQYPVADVRHVGDLAQLVARHKLGHGGGAAWPDRGEILIYPQALAQLELPEDVDRVGHGSRAARARARQEIFTGFTSLAVVQDALAEGWELGNERMDVRTLVTHPDHLPGGAQITVLSWFDWQGNPLFAVSDRGQRRDTLASPEVVVDRLQEFADLTGITWRVSGGQTGVDMVDVLHVPTNDPEAPKRGYFVRGQEPVLPDFLKPAVRRRDSRFSGAAEEVFSWCRPWATLMGEERSSPYVIAFDHSANFRGPFLSTEVGVRDLVELKGGDAVWDGAEKPGYWMVSAWDTPMWNLPDPADANGIIAGQHQGDVVRIVTAHTLKQLEILDKELPYGLKYHQAWIWRDHSRVLSQVGRSLTEAGKVGTPAVVAAQKQVYSQMVQKFASVDYPPTQKHLRQPPIRDFIVGAARTSIMRTLANVFDTTGLSPLAVSRDTIFYAVATDDPQAAWPGKPEKYGTGPGQWKPTGIAHLEQWGPTCLPDPGPNAGRKFDYGRAMSLMTKLDPATGQPLPQGGE